MMIIGIFYLVFCIAVKKRFREDAESVHKHDWHTIEHMIRQGYKQKKIIEMPGFSSANIKSIDHEQ